MYFLLNMGIFDCYVSLPEGINLQGVLYRLPLVTPFQLIMSGFERCSLTKTCQDFGLRETYKVGPLLCSYKFGYGPLPGCQWQMKA